MSKTLILGSQDDQLGQSSREALLVDRLRVAEAEVRRLRKNLAAKDGNSRKEVKGNKVWICIETVFVRISSALCTVGRSLSHDVLFCFLWEVTLTICAEQCCSTGRPMSS